MKYGNTVTSGSAGGEKDLASADRDDIVLDPAKTADFLKSGTTLQKIYQGSSIHEIGHNIGGVHGDPGSIMIQALASEGQTPGCIGNCGTGVYSFRLPGVSIDGTRAIMGRMGTMRSSVESRYLTDKETKKLNNQIKMAGLHTSKKVL